MKRTETNKPDLMPAFRSFAVLWLGLMVLPLIGNIIRASDIGRLLRDWLFVLNAGILVAYLYMPYIEERLGGAYLPLALGIAALGPLLVLYWPLPRSPIAEVGTQLLVMSTIRMFVLWITVTVMLAWAYDLWTVWAFSAGIGIVSMVVPWLLGGIPQSFLMDFGVFSLFITVTTALVGYLVVGLSSAERQQRRELAAVNEQLVQYASTLENLTISRERNRMARELHDTLAHTLSGLAVQLETTRAILDTDIDKSRTLLEQSLEITRSGLQETRNALQSLRATPLEDLGLRMALIRLGEMQAQRTGARLELDIADNLPALPAEIEQTIYRTAQEAAANVVRHATARTLTLKLAVEDDEIRLVVADDGVGFDVQNLPAGGHYGLAGMRERAALVNGQVAISSQPGQGTEVELTIEREKA